MASGRSSDMDQAGPSSAPSDTKSGNCTHFGKYIQRDLGKYIAFYHL